MSETVELFSRTRGEGPDLVLLHGLFGSADNVGMLARGLESQYKVTCFDLRDHGRSPHSNAISYPLMAADVLRGLDALGIKHFHLFGHSMGGKTAMEMASIAPERLSSMMVGDIAPVDYPHNHEAVLAGQEAVAERALNNPELDRADAEAILRKHIEEEMVISFLLTNWRRLGEGAAKRWGWRHNLGLIVRDYSQISKAPSFTEPFRKKVLFLKGGLSDYITEKHAEAIKSRFPDAALKVLGGTGHWFHAEKTEMTLRLMGRFLEEAQQ